jgi:uncharacterized protein YtpQ (UPF0354 family)
LALGMATLVNADDVIGCVLPQFFPTLWLDPPGIVFTDFPSRIRVGYVLRDGGAYSYIMDEEFSQLSLSLNELRSAALLNLARLPTANISIANVPEGAEGWISAPEDNFGAVRILLPNVQREFQARLGDDFLVTLPHRDDCFCWSSTQSQERQARHIHKAREQFLHDEYNLTPDILRCSRHGFKLHFQQSSA